LRARSLGLHRYRKVAALLSALLALLTLLSFSAFLMLTHGVGSINTQVSEDKPRNPSLSSVPVYVIGELSNRSGLNGMLKLRGGTLKLKVVKIETFSAPPRRSGIVVITRKLRPIERNAIIDSILRGSVIVVTGRTVHDQVSDIISRVVAVTVSANGTEVYFYKVIGRHAVNGHYPVLIAGFTDTTLSKEVLKEAISALSLSVNDGRIIAIIRWFSGVAWRPYGKLSIAHIVYRYPNDFWTDKELNVVECVTKIVSGSKLGWGSDGRVWLNDFIRSKYVLNHYTRIYHLIDYEPSSMNGGERISVSFFPELMLSWSYGSYDIASVDDDGDLGADVAGWMHDVGTWYSPGVADTVQVMPGFEYITSPVKAGSQLWIITAGWVGTGLNPEIPIKHVRREVLITVRFAS